MNGSVKTYQIDTEIPGKRHACKRHMPSIVSVGTKTCSKNNGVRQNKD